ncbi:hypothetical protein [Kribbella sancticallisti]|uniref:alpha/beta hydrolase n=1 Tax=Kribbella sancticallisti TaxID=460087 RepID=UPI0031E11AB1
MNGLRFSHVLAYSPGFMVWAAREGRPKVFVSHGTEDRILPIDRCSRRIVPLLEDGGYDVEYHEFTGGHVLRPELVAAATDLFLA